MSTNRLTQSEQFEVESSQKPATEQDEHDVSKNFEVPAPVTTSFQVLKDRIRHHYEKASDYYQSLWGEHIHHGYFKTPSDTKEQAQIQLIKLLLERSKLACGSTVLDVGCGLGGTSRYLARHMDCKVTGITISGRQVEIAKSLTADDFGGSPKGAQDTEIFQQGKGEVRYIELDAEHMGDHFGFAAEPVTFNCVWIVEAMSHIPNKELFFRNTEMLLEAGGKLVVADWFKAEDLSDAQVEADVKPIEDGMLLPPLCTQQEYVRFAQDAGLKVLSPPFDISKDVSKSWDIGWSIIQNPALWAFALTQGRDAIAFLQAFRAMRRGYANGTFRYAVMAFERDGGHSITEESNPVSK